MTEDFTYPIDPNDEDVPPLFSISAMAASAMIDAYNIQYAEGLDNAVHPRPTGRVRRLKRWVRDRLEDVWCWLGE